MLKVCLTHDIDRVYKTYQYITKPLRALFDGNVKLAFDTFFSFLHEKNPYWGFNHIIDIENKYNIKSTFFFLDESIKFNMFKPKEWKLSLGRYNIKSKKIARMITFLDEKGWEIALHGSYNSYNDNSLLVKEKRKLENIVKHPIVGVRQHYLNLGESTWTYQNDAGFMYGSTWGFTKKFGFRDSHVKPFYPIPNSNFCEIPYIIMDSPFLDNPDKWTLFEEICNECEDKDGYLVIGFHNSVFNDTDTKEAKSVYIEMIERVNKRNCQFMLLKDAYYGHKV